jgi:hypothetical protein
MRKNKVALIGKGTAGCQAAAHLFTYMPTHELDWYFDPETKPQAVGEGSNLVMPRAMYATLNLNYEQLMREVDGSLKLGIYKSNWGKTGKDFIHFFPPPSTAIHFNALKLQDFIFEKLSKEARINVIEKNVKPEDVDADYVMDCSGRPKTLEEYSVPRFIPVNSVHVNQCYWDFPRLNYTITEARPYGWVFGIPLQNRCSIGYLYNDKINTLEEVKEDINVVIDKYKLQKSDTTNSFSFGNYYRKQNFKDRIAYNGNASFFLEPLEATSTAMMDYIQRMAWDIWHGNMAPDTANQKYAQHLNEIERTIMLHYFAGSVFKTDFWEYAQERGQRCMEEAMKDPRFVYHFYAAKNGKKENEVVFSVNTEYGTWWEGSFIQNIPGLGILKDLEKLL